MNARLSEAMTLPPVADYSRWDFVQAQRWRVVLAPDARAGLGAGAEAASAAWLALADRACDGLLLQRLETELQASVRWQRCEASELDALLASSAQQYRAMAGLQAATGEDASQTPLHELSAQRLAQESNPVIRMLDSLLYDGLQEGASDIHMECTALGMNIRNRIDGVMLALQSIPDVSVAEQLISRLKVMAELDIGERRLPQDGRFKLRVQGRNIDFRLSIMPSVFGEDAVIRVLDRAQIDQAQGSLTLESLGFDAPTRAAIRRLAALPHGMLLMTGPTGSGKTTTLYAALNALNSTERKIITAEDPVEYRLAGLNQVQVQDKIDMTFERILRSALRQDPDVILVGEMRDKTTAEIGMRAAMTGHLVLSTLHTNDASSTPARLIDMGVPQWMVALSLQLVVAQRLVRTVCQGCTAPHEPSPNELVWLRSELGHEVDYSGLRQGRGCPDCNHTGYRGRTGVYEFLQMTLPLVDAMSGNDPAAFGRAAREQMAGNTLRRDAARLSLTGRTTLAEAMGVSAQVD